MAVRRLAVVLVVLAACSHDVTLQGHVKKACRLEVDAITRLAHHDKTVAEMDERMKTAESEVAAAARMAGKDEFKQVDLHSLDESIPQANRNLRASSSQVLTTAGVGDVLDGCEKVSS